jgi:hypothetical protein
VRGANERLGVRDTPIRREAFAPPTRRRLYAEELRLLDWYAHKLSRTTPRIVPATGRGVVLG